jgi:hypothetical protein
MAISSATINREREDEWEAESMRVELVHLRHQVEYYQGHHSGDHFHKG